LGGSRKATATIVSWARSFSPASLVVQKSPALAVVCRPDVSPPITNLEAPGAGSLARALMNPPPQIPDWWAMTGVAMARTGVGRASASADTSAAWRCTHRGLDGPLPPRGRYVIPGSLRGRPRSARGFLGSGTIARGGSPRPDPADRADDRRGDRVP